MRRFLLKEPMHVSLYTWVLANLAKGGVQVAM